MLDWLNEKLYMIRGTKDARKQQKLLRELHMMVQYQILAGQNPASSQTVQGESPLPCTLSLLKGGKV